MTFDDSKRDNVIQVLIRKGPLRSVFSEGGPFSTATISHPFFSPSYFLQSFTGYMYSSTCLAPFACLRLINSGCPLLGASRGWHLRSFGLAAAADRERIKVKVRNKRPADRPGGWINRLSRRRRVSVNVGTHPSLRGSS